MSKLKPHTSTTKIWYSTGVQFECQGSGQCCTSRGEYGYVYLTKEDLKNMARFFNLTTQQFLAKYCGTTDGIPHIKDVDNSVDCRFLKKNKCQIYLSRPTQCRTWPFWPENMDAKAWTQDVAKNCPGIGKGPTHSLKQIKQTLAEQRASEKRLLKERLNK